MITKLHKHTVKLLKVALNLFGCLTNT